MRKLSRDQKRTLSEFLANIGVAWFATGFIIPVFSEKKEINQVLTSAFLGAIGALIWIITSLFILKGKT